MPLEELLDIIIVHICLI